MSNRASVSQSPHQSAPPVELPFSGRFAVARTRRVWDRIAPPIDGVSLKLAGFNARGAMEIEYRGEASRDTLDRLAREILANVRELDHVRPSSVYWRRRV